MLRKHPKGNLRNRPKEDRNVDGREAIDLSLIEPLFEGN